MFNSSPSTMLPQEASLSHFPYKLFRGLAFKDLLSTGPPPFLPFPLSPSRLRKGMRQNDLSRKKIYAPFLQSVYRSVKRGCLFEPPFHDDEKLRNLSLERISKGNPAPPLIVLMAEDTGGGEKEPFYSNTEFSGTGIYLLFVLENFLKILLLEGCRVVDYYYYYYC